MKVVLKVFHSKVQPLENCFVLRALITGHNLSLELAALTILKKMTKTGMAGRGGLQHDLGCLQKISSR